MTRIYRKSGMAKKSGHHPVYKIWKGMINRCYRPYVSEYRYYGKRGIDVCDDWYRDPKIFLGWSLENGWEEGLTIDRIDVDKGYSPDNCRWIPSSQQSENTRLIRSNNTSGFRGVCLNKQRYGDSKWMAYCKINGKMKNLGRFNSKEEAARARDEFVVENNLKLPLNFGDR